MSIMHWPPSNLKLSGIAASTSSLGLTFAYSFERLDKDDLMSSGEDSVLDGLLTMTTSRPYLLLHELF